MPTHITIDFGLSKAFLLREKDSFILIDTGGPGKADLFFDHLAIAGVLPAQIKLIVITHAHFDHVGSLARIKEKCGCDAAAHPFEATLMETAKVVIPGGTNFITRPVCNFMNKQRHLLERFYRYPPLSPEIRITDTLPLETYGISASILHTPGHTQGSLSILTHRGDAFVGDLAFNFFPFGKGPYFPPVGDDSRQILDSWEKLLTMGAKTIFPAHGVPFPSKILKNRLQSRR